MARYDVVIIGSGIAGLSAALATVGRARTLLLAKDSLEETNTRYAQGGIAAALAIDDSAGAHLHDTVAAGSGLVNRDAAAVLTTEARDAVEWLVELGVPVDLERGRIALGREAAHSAARIVHAGGDATGLHVEHTLAQRVLDAGVELRDQTLVTRLVVERGQVIGVETLDEKSGAHEQIEAPVVILATGGAGRLYSHTTNPAVATGDGIALAFRAGAELVDLEFIQFHPTAFCAPGSPSFLISEAVRGEGAVLRDCHGRQFMWDYDSRAELAPRDVLARALHSQMARTGSDNVYLDCSHLDSNRVRSRFPQIDRFCRERGLDITRDQIPVAPAAHYTMGGVCSTAWGATNVSGLFACGEVACTGVHGANRLASNSLLEGIVFARRAVDRALSGANPPSKRGDALALPPAEMAESGLPTLAGIQALMWERVGIVRSGEGLRQARSALAAWEAAVPEPVSRSDEELRNLLLLGRLVAEAAGLRRESRGSHYRLDFPQTDRRWRRHLVFRRDGGERPCNHQTTRRARSASYGHDR